jgi:hypothetical protein
MKCNFCKEEKKQAYPVKHTPIMTTAIYIRNSDELICRDCLDFTLDEMEGLLDEE